MGRYINRPDSYPKRKAEYLIENGAKEVSVDEARAVVLEAGKNTVVVVVDNGRFEAAAHAFSMEEFEAFTRSQDSRPKRYFVMDAKWVLKNSR